MTTLPGFKIISNRREADFKLATQDKKQQILATAKNLFLSSGYKATTIQNIADAANVSKGAVYLHFSSKQEIIFEIAVQTEDVVWQQVQTIRADPSLDPRKRLERILETYIGYMHENRLLDELLVLEVGLTLTDAMLAETMALRQRWQQTIESCVADFLGGNYDRWNADLGFCLNAIVDGFHAFLLVENVEIPTEAISQFLLLMVETMGPALKEKKLPALLQKDYLEKRNWQLQEIESKRKSDVESLLEKLDKLVSGQTPTDSEQATQQKILMDTIQILTTECNSAEPNKAILQGMLASLRRVDELSRHRQRLAILLGVKLI